MILVKFCYTTNFGGKKKLKRKIIKFPFLPKKNLREWFRITHKTLNISAIYSVDFFYDDIKRTF